MDNLKNKVWVDKDVLGGEAPKARVFEEVVDPGIEVNPDLEFEKTRQKLEAAENLIKEMRDREIARLGSDFEAFMLWSRRREKILPLDNTFYAFEDAWKKAQALIVPLQNYFDPLIYKDVLFSAGLHYIICEPYLYDSEDLQGNIVEAENPLYKRYNILAKSFIVSSASDEGSSSSIHTTKSLNDGDFMMQDLLRTRYGQWVYSILEQLDVGPVLL